MRAACPAGRMFPVSLLSRTAVSRFWLPEPVRNGSPCIIIAAEPMRSTNSFRNRLFPFFLLIVLIAAGCLLPPLLRAAASVPPVRPYGVARFRRQMRWILSQPLARLADWGILVEDERTGQVLYEHNADHFFTPASNAKLFTSTLALNQLGPDYRWRTTLETAGQLEPDGTLKGDLVLVGRGDPNLSNRVFPVVFTSGEAAKTEGPADKVIAELVDQLVAKGVKRVTGDVVADDSYFTYHRYPPGWNIDDLTEYYGAPVSAIVIDDNTLEIDVTPGERLGDPATLSVHPWPAFYHFIDHVTTVRHGMDPQISIRRQLDSLNVTLTGQVSAGNDPQKEYLAIEQPARYAAALLRHLLIEQGVKVDGGTAVVHLLPDETPPPPPVREVLAEHESPTLAETLRYLLKVSQNLHAECLLRTVAHVRTGVGSLQNGLAVEQGLLARLGIARDVEFFDGSGLSRYDLVTPRALVTLLRYDAKQSWAKVLISALPVAGQDGTLQDRMADTPAEGRVFAKTGTLAHDNSLSGYATTLGGRRIVFSILVNNTPPNSRFDPFLDKVAEAIVEDIGGRGRVLPVKRSRRRR